MYYCKVHKSLKQYYFLRSVTVEGLRTHSCVIVPVVILFNESAPILCYHYYLEKLLAPLEKLASVVLLIVVIAELFVLTLEALVEILDALVEIPDALVAMSVSLEVMLVVLLLMLDSTLDILPSVNVPSISASLRMVTVPEV